MTHISTLTLLQSRVTLKRFQAVRARSAAICEPLNPEDMVVQPIVDVSPPKWHLGHTTWFFEEFVLSQNLADYQRFHPQYHFVFNSYYETVGARVLRTDRGNLSRPSVSEVMEYRTYVNAAMEKLFEQELSDELLEVIELGLNHEEQHQELLAYDIKYILGHNPLFPGIDSIIKKPQDFIADQSQQAITIEAGMYQIGYEGEGFCFDNELGKHEVYLQKYAIDQNLVTNREYLAFIEAGGYQQFQHWLSEAWSWVNDNNISAPEYWMLMDGTYMIYDQDGLKPLPLDEPVMHISYYEAEAFARWKGKRLPTEFEWEIASKHFTSNHLWQWTASAYLPYPKFVAPEGAIGEYNGKFMINQMVLRGGSYATAPNHYRDTYRNFFHPNLRWLFVGFRLAEHL